MKDWFLKAIDGVFFGWTWRFRANGYVNKRKDNILVDKGTIRGHMEKENNPDSGKA